MSAKINFDDLWEKLSETHPGFSKTSFFGEVSWGSLEWTAFLAEAVSDLSPAKKDEAIRRLFLESDFEKLNFVSFTGILYDLAKDS